MEFTCVEQYMMFMKAKLFEDHETADEIMSITNPRTIKRLGRSVRNFNPKVWDDNKYSIVFEGCLAKFSQNEGLKKRLLATEGTIVEASPYDVIWGIGLREDDPHALDPSKWRGENLLGEILTDVRTLLFIEETEEAFDDLMERALGLGETNEQSVPNRPKQYTP